MRGRGEGKAYTKVKMEYWERWRICGHPLGDISRSETSEPQVDRYIFSAALLADCCVIIWLVCSFI